MIFLFLSRKEKDKIAIIGVPECIAHEI